MLYTISTRKPNYHRIMQAIGNSITLPNGTKCNSAFYWYCVTLGIIDPDKD